MAEHATAALIRCFSETAWISTELRTEDWRSDPRADRVEGGDESRN
jgi:hypothetical protein